MKISRFFPVLIATGLVMMAAKQHATFIDKCESLSEQLKTVNQPNAFCNNLSPSTPLPKRKTVELIYEKDIPLLFIPSYFKYRESTSRYRNVTRSGEIIRSN